MSRMQRKTFRNRCFAIALILMLAWMCSALAENLTSGKTDTAVPEVTETVAPEAPAAENTEAASDLTTENEDPEIDFWGGIKKIAQSTGFAKGTWQQYVMIAVACVLLYLAIVQQFEPLLLMPIAFGMLLANLPLAGLMGDPSYSFFDSLEAAKAAAVASRHDVAEITYRLDEATNTMRYGIQTSNGGLLYYLYKGVKLGIYPPLIFMGVGAMTDFAPLIANPSALLMGAAAQLGIFITFIGAKALFGFTAREAAATGIIGGADGPTAIFLTTRLAPELLGAIAVAAYSYMALIPLIQPPIMNLLTSAEDRKIKMVQTRTVSKAEKIIFPIVVVIFVALLLPDTAPLIGCLMLGNLFKETGATDRLSDTAQNALMNIVTILLSTAVGATMVGSTFLTASTLKIVVLGVVAFGISTAGGLWGGNVMCKLTGGKVNPLIGSAGVSAVPMAARVSNTVGQKNNPSNFLLMHAMGPNVAGVIGSAIAAGFLLSVFG